MKVSGDKLFFTSDPHFNHFNIINYCNRGFDSVANMDYQLQVNWNSVVPEDGIVFVLGDFAFVNNVEAVLNITKRLNGQKRLIMGNHDYHTLKRKTSFLSAGFAAVDDYLDLTVVDPEIDEGCQRLFLCHYPMVTWAGASKGAWNLFGHIHSNGVFPSFASQSPKSLDVGMDANNMRPISYQEVKTKITHQALKALKQQ